MKVAYVDDSDHDRSQAMPVFKKGFEDYKLPVKIFDFFESGNAFIENWVAGSYDLIILDIFMDSITGVEIANRIREQDRNVRLVFCSTSNEFANESYDVNACYYIQKPVTEQSVSQMISRLNIEDFELRRFVILPDGQRLLLRNIIYAEYSNHKVEIHIKQGSNIKTWISFSRFVNLLDPYDYFLICNSGSLINLWEVSEVSGDIFIMSNSDRISISRRKKNDVLSQYRSFLVNSVREGLK